eukprot:TRINITY_DN989_c0_g1_i4.p4 TRINITY_DN989_c0_g1~~TRINITY_DN989_c0_g1_i4.p4  ORF type:complete len:122 (-),score=26.81 TRINITY_DN989_c0_g1_i4:38-403(-)
MKLILNVLAIDRFLKYKTSFYNKKQNANNWLEGHNYKVVDHDFKMIYHPDSQFIIKGQLLPVLRLLDFYPKNKACLLYTSDAADEEDSVDLGGRRIIKKKKKTKETNQENNQKESTSEEKV